MTFQEKEKINNRSKQGRTLDKKAREEHSLKIKAAWVKKLANRTNKGAVIYT